MFISEILITRGLFLFLVQIPFDKTFYVVGREIKKVINKWASAQLFSSQPAHHHSTLMQPILI